MPSVLKTLLDNLSSKISVNTSDVTEINNRLNDVDSGVTLEEYINTNNSNISKLQSDLKSVGTDISSIESDVAEISSGLTSVRSEVTTARGGSASLDARLDTITTATENAQSDAETAQTTANEAASSANTANSDIAAAADTFNSLKARLDAMTTDITNVTDVADTATTDIAEALTRITTAESDITELGTELNETNSTLTAVSTQVNSAKGPYDSLSRRIAANGFTGFGRVLNTTAKQAWVSLSPDVHYYDVTGNETEQASAIYTIKKLSDIPILVTVSIANILTVTSIDLLPTSISSINIEGVLYSVYAIQLPNSTLIGNAAVQNSYVDSPVVFAPDSNSITMSLIGNLGNMGSTVSSSEYNAYLPVLRPATSPGTVFKFLSTKIDPDTNTVQYSTFNSSITIPL